MSELPDRNVTRETSGANVITMRLCKKHRRPLRKGQRNCHQCHREANKEYRESLLRDARRFRMSNQNKGA